MSDLYNTDILGWSEHSAEQLHRHAARANDPALDWPHIIEEIESVGSEPRHAVTSLLVQALAHRRKAEAWPLCRDVPHWLADARRFRGDATDRYTPSMRQRIDLARIYRRALRPLPDTLNDQVPLPVPAICPVTLDAVLSED
jgi:hypothetical protein